MAEPQGSAILRLWPQNRGLNVITETRVGPSNSRRARARLLPLRDAIHFATAFTFIGMPLVSSFAPRRRRHKYDERARLISDNAAGKTQPDRNVRLPTTEHPL
jgi:hypothetical protein